MSSGTGQVEARRNEGLVPWQGRTILAAFDPRRNSLNLVRLVLALMVLLAHSYTLSGNGFGPLFNGDHLGTWAVYGFFCLSGYLITGSRLRTRFVDFLSHRIARIFPGFLVSLVVVVAGFAPIAYVRQHGSIDGYLTTPATPLHHVVANMGLSMHEWSVAGTLTANPYPHVWNGSLWSLYYEFLCYLAVGALLSFAVMRRHAWLLVPTFLLTVLVVGNADTVVDGYFGGNRDVALLVDVLPFFMGGAAVYALRGVIPLTRWSALVSAVGLALLVSADGTWGPALAAPFITVLLMWLGKVLPCPELLRRHDISYGCYIYAFPSQQLVAALGGAAWGTYVHAALALPITVALATASWLLVERRAMRVERRGEPLRVATVSPVAAPTAVSG